MAAEVVQQNSGHTGVATPATVDVTLPGNTAASNTLLIGVSADVTVQTPAGFTLDRSQVNNNGHYLFRKTTVAGEASWTVTLSSGASAAWWVQEVSGLDTTPLDQTTSVGSSVSVNSISTGTTGTTAQADEYLVATWGLSNSTADGQATFGAISNGFTQQTEQYTTKVSGTNAAILLATKTVAATGTFESTASLETQAKPATGIIATYKIADATPARNYVWEMLPPRAKWTAGAPTGKWATSRPVAKWTAGRPQE